MDGVFSPQPDLQVPEGNSGNSGDSIYNCNYVYCPPDFPFGLHQSTDVLTEYLLKDKNILTILVRKKGGWTMKKYLLLRTALVLFLLFILTLSHFSLSEAASLEQAIIGKWSQDKNGGIIEYLEDGTLLYADGTTGTWKVLSDGRLKIELVVPFLGRMVEIFKVSIQGDKLTTIDRKGRVDVFQKIK